MNVEYPILNAPMGPDISGVELAAAVSNAGGLGMFQAQYSPPNIFRSEIRRLKELTDKPFGVNLIHCLPHEDNLHICIKKRIPFLSFF